LFFGIELILKIEKTGHFLIVAIVKGINEHMATKIPDVVPSNPFNLKSPNHRRKIPNMYLNAASRLPTFFFISLSSLINGIKICGHVKEKAKSTIVTMQLGDIDVQMNYASF
jgi:hypothetical protein